MTERDIGAEILEGLKEIKEFKKGKAQLRTVKLSVPLSARQIRERLKLSQSAFASMMGVSVRTVQDWEQGRRTPKGPARSLLRIAEQNPKAFLSVSFAA
jgi:putative transcriptional regulator